MLEFRRVLTHVCSDLMSSQPKSTQNHITILPQFKTIAAHFRSRNASVSSTTSFILAPSIFKGAIVVEPDGK